MRTLWLASTALLLSAAFASAQSTQTSPAPTGAIGAPKVTAPGASPGNMAPTSTPANTSMSLSSKGASSNITSSPAPNGAVSAPDVTAAAPNASPGKMAPAQNAGASTAATPSASDSAMNTPPHPSHHHWASHSMTLPQDASATTYLHIAKSAILHHNVSLADDALSHAETRLLDRSVPQGEIAADNSPSIQSIESARQALHSGNYSQASADTKQASDSVSSM